VVFGVEHHGHPAGALHAEIGDDPVERVGGVERHPLARTHVLAAQASRHSLGCRLELVAGE